MSRPEPSIWEIESFTGKTDLLIIGAGIVGSSAALFWKQKFPDSRVVVVDRGLIPAGASTRNAGFACIGSLSEHLDDIQQSSEQKVLARIRRRWEGLKLLRQTLGDEIIGYEACGGHEIFTENKLYETCFTSLERINTNLEKNIGEKDVYSQVKINGFRAVYNRLEGAIHAGKMMYALHRKLQEAGVPVWWNTEVLRTEQNLAVFAGGGSMEAGMVLAATNGFTSQLADLPIQPARGCVLLTTPLPEMPWRGTFHYNRGYVYFRNFGDRLMIGGARDIDMEVETTDQFGINPYIRSWLIDFAKRILKLPGGWEVEREWSGIMGFTPDKEPLITITESGLWVAAGLSGMGVAIGMAVARDAVEKMAEE